MNDRSEQLTLREYPIFGWFFGLAALAFGAYTLRTDPAQVIMPIGAAVVCLLFFGLSSILVVKADRSTGTLTIQRISLLRRYKRELPVSSLAAIQMEQTSSYDSSSSSHRSTSYRIVAITRDQEIIPFRIAYSGGRWAKEANAKKLREFLGVGGADMSISGMLKTASGMAAEKFKEEQETITGDQDTEQVTDGVHWKLETKSMGGSPVSRWFSPDFQWNGNFVYIAQKMQGQTSQGGLMSVVGKMLFKTSLSLYGFTSELTPGLDSAEILTPLDAQLEPLFTAFTNNPSEALQLLNPWTAMPLAAWAQKYPLKQGNTNQLAILFSPQGVYVAMLGLVNPEFLNELTALGVELVKAQGSSR
jgi:hypothetical protein